MNLLPSTTSTFWCHAATHRNHPGSSHHPRTFHSTLSSSSTYPSDIHNAFTTNLGVTNLRHLMRGRAQHTQQHIYSTHFKRGVPQYLFMTSLHHYQTRNSCTAPTTHTSLYDQFHITSPSARSRTITSYARSRKTTSYARSRTITSYARSRTTKAFATSRKCTT